ncbi:MAG: DUF4412 domain-containing protein, partial [Deltaproteobacteria bacterium]|nr:DUF4412 domain-containing protein [Deltaproteobacteria bacterium]
MKFIISENFAKKILSIFCFGIVLLFTFPASGAQFSADIIQGKHGKTTKGKFFLKDNFYRMDIKDDGKPISIVVDLKEGNTRILLHSEKVYLEVNNNGIKSLSNNPFQVFEYTSERYKAKQLGTENISGYTCHKSLIKAQGK